MNGQFRLTALLVFALFFYVNIITLNDGHNWGDDFAQYIRHAVNLVEHKPYACGISLDLRVIPPPGYPLLLSSLVYWCGINFKILKSLNILLWALAALAVFGIVLDSLDFFWAAMITGWFLSSPVFFFFKQNVLSDIPFMCFVLFSLWACLRSEDYRQKGSGDQSMVFLGISVFFMSYAMLIRWAGLTLFLAVLVYYVLIKREWKRPLVFMAGGFASWIVAFQFGSLAMGYVDRTTVSLLQNSFLISWMNLGLTFRNILNLFISDDKFLPDLSASPHFILIDNCAGVLFLGLTGVFLLRLSQRRLSLMGCFTFIYLAAVVCWPVNAGTRYLLPVMLPLAVCSVKFLKPDGRKWAAAVFALLIIQNIYVIAADFKFNDDDIYQKESLEMMQWVKLHIRPEDNYMFSKPRALGLLTGRIGHNFGAYPQDVKNWYRRIKPLHVDYLIVDKGFNQFSRYDNFSLRIDNYVLYINLVWKNGFYRIFKVTFPKT